MSPDKLTKIRDAWQPFYPNEVLTLQDAQNISDRLTGFFRLLMEEENKKA